MAKLQFSYAIGDDCDVLQSWLVCDMCKKPKREAGNRLPDLMIVHYAKIEFKKYPHIFRYFHYSNNIHWFCSNPCRIEHQDLYGTT